MTNEDYKNELDWLRNNWPLLGRFEYKPDEAVHTTIGRVAELLYLHAFGTGRLGAAVSASPQREIQAAKNVLLERFAKTFDQVDFHEMAAEIRAEIVPLDSSIFAAAPAQEPDERINIQTLDTGVVDRLDDALKTAKAAQKQPVENSRCKCGTHQSNYIHHSPWLNGYHKFDSPNSPQKR